MKSVNDTWCYKLYPLDKSVNHDIKGLISAYSREYYPNYARKGQIFPTFNYVDLNGNIYNDETTRGKIIVLKFWFMRCVNCVKEMPEVNALYKKYKTRKDIIFLSLAFDPKKDLQQFLTRTRFDVPVIPASANYIENTLNVRAFPTIMIINKDRKILKVANDAEELKYELKKLY
jgi:peroxiredoxin